jgi:hypothetical protein
VLAELLVREGKPAEAVPLFAHVASGYRDTVAAGKAIGPVGQRRYAAALAGQARLAPASAADWYAIVALLEPDRDKLAPEAAVLLAEAYAHGGRTDDADAVLAPLHAAGYRHPDFMAVLGRFPALLASTHRAAR